MTVEVPAETPSITSVLEDNVALATVGALLLTLYGAVPPETVVVRELALRTVIDVPESTVSSGAAVAGTAKLLVVTVPRGVVNLTFISVPPAHGEPSTE